MQNFSAPDLDDSVVLFNCRTAYTSAYINPVEEIVRHI